MLCGRGNSFSIISTLKLKVLSKKAKRNTFVMFGKKKTGSTWAENSKSLV